MKRFSFFISLISIIILLLQLQSKSVFADVCWGSRTVNQYYCSGGGKVEICSSYGWYYTGPGKSGTCDGVCSSASTSCSGTDNYGNYWTCSYICDGTSNTIGSGGTCTLSGSTEWACNPPPACNIKSGADIRNCGYDSSGLCQDSTVKADTFQCYGPGDPPAVCGNFTCETGETCSSCPTDCSCTGVSPTPTGGATPTPTGTGTPTPTPSGSPTPTPSGSPTPTPTVIPTPTPPPTCPPAGAPAAPTGLNPANGATLVPDSSGNVTFSWSFQPDANEFEVRVYPTGTPAADECNIAVQGHCPALPLTTNTYSFALDPGVTSYTWKVRALNTNPLCGVGTEVSAWSPLVIVVVSGTIQGNFYLDDASTSFPIGNSCTTVASLPSQAPPGGTTIQAVPAAGSPIAGSITGTAYSVDNVPATLGTRVQLLLGSLGYRCVCPSGCEYSVTAPVTGLNYYIATSRAPWWQSRNGLIFGGNSSGQAIQSNIPNTCELAGPAVCKPGLSLKDGYNTADSEGYVMSGGGAIDSTLDSSTQYDYLREDRGTSYISGTTLKTAREDYDYFSGLFSMGDTPSPDTISGSKPASAPVNGRAYYVNGDLDITSDWVVNAKNGATPADSMVIFVNGNLNVKKTITVAEGGFLAFIVKNNITFDATIGQSLLTKSSAADAVAQGVYIANGQIIVNSNGSSDLKFIGAGTFVGWNGFQLNRRYFPDATNNTFPTDIFIYRPDFIFTLPPRMTKPYQLWQETNL